MEWIRRIWKKPSDSDEAEASWAPYLKPEELAAFLRVVASDLKARGFDFQLHDGFAFVKTAPGDAPTRFGLQNISQVCGMSPRETWPETVRHHFDVLFKGNTDLDRIQNDFESARSLLKVRIYPDDMLEG